MFIGFLPMVINYRFRLISAEGLFPVIFFAGVGIERCYESLDKFFKDRKIDPQLSAFYFASLFVLINFFSPTISLYTTTESDGKKKELNLFLRDSAMANLLPVYKKHTRPIEINLYLKDTETWLKIIKENTQDDDIICSNYTYIGGVLSAFSGRANAARLFYEIKEPSYPVNEIASSKLVVWLRETDGTYHRDLKKCIEKYSFRKVAETNLATILISQNAPKSEVAKPVISANLALMILFCGFVAILYDLARPRKKFNNLSKSSLE